MTTSLIFPTASTLYCFMPFSPRRTLSRVFSRPDFPIVSVRSYFFCCSFDMLSYSSLDICPVYPITEAKYWLSTYLLIESSAISTPSNLSIFSIITATVSSLTSVASVVGIYFWKLLSLIAYLIFTILRT